MVLVVKNNGYKWASVDGIYFKGYFEFVDDVDRKVYRNAEAISLFQTVTDETIFEDILAKIDGVYAIIISLPGKTLFATDRSRSMPLYYSVNPEIVSDSAEEIRKELSKSEEVEINFKNYLSLYATDYLFGHYTAYEGIFQLDLGEYCCIENSRADCRKYYEHYAKICNRSSTEEYKVALNEAANHAFQRIKAAIGDRPVVLSMSGGYDSRFVGCMLKNAGVTDVSCYTYGKADSFEVKQSKKNAEALGFRWKCVEYTDEEVCRTVDGTGQEYFDYYTGHDFVAYIQNFPAVRKLHEEGWIKPNSVFITGLCGDMPTGNYILPYDSTKEYTAKTAAERLYQLIFTRYDMPKDFSDKWISDITDKIKKLSFEVTDYQSWVSAVDCIYTGTCHSHWFMHMNTVHDFFGYEWLLPYWDEELLNTWYSIPAEIKMKQSLYEDWLLNDICQPYGIGTKKYRATYSRKKFVRNLKYVVGGVLNYIILRSGHVFKRKYDYNNFAPLEAKLYKMLPNKHTVFYRKAGIMFLLNQYLLQKRYGVEIMKKAKKVVKVRKS